MVTAVQTVRPEELCADRLNVVPTAGPARGRKGALCGLWQTRRGWRKRAVMIQSWPRRCGRFVGLAVFVHR